MQKIHINKRAIPLLNNKPRKGVGSLFGILPEDPFRNKNKQERKIPENKERLIKEDEARKKGKVYKQKWYD